MISHDPAFLNKIDPEVKSVVARRTKRAFCEVSSLAVNQQGCLRHYTHSATFFSNLLAKSRVMPACISSFGSQLASNKSF